MALATTIEPASWVGGLATTPGLGGGVGTITQFNNRQLVVRNTVEVHEKIAGYFTHGR